MGFEVAPGYELGENLLVSPSHTPAVTTLMRIPELRDHPPRPIVCDIDDHK
jgi:hypothetical protein